MCIFLHLNFNQLNMNTCSLLVKLIHCYFPVSGTEEKIRQFILLIQNKKENPPSFSI